MTKLKPRWRIVPYMRNQFGDLLYTVITPLKRRMRPEPFLSIADAMKAIRIRFDNNA